MSEEPGFTPDSPLTRKARKRSWLLVWVLIGLVVGTALIILIEPYVSPWARTAAGVVYGLLLALVFIGRFLLIRQDLRSKVHRDKWFGRMLDRNTPPGWP
jgi:hypothetical protein